MELTVKGSGSVKQFKLQGIEASLTVLEVKQKCKEECGLETEQQRLFFKGKLLKDEDTLEAAKIADKATLFLVKGAAPAGDAAAAASSSPAKEEKKEEEVPAGPAISCLGGCGFFGNPKSENYCSKCWAKKTGKDEKKEAEAKKQESKKEEEEKKEEEKKEGEEEGKKEEEVVKEEQKDKTRCWFCQKKCGLTGFECRCGYTFCAKHRYAEEHNCGFDHMAAGREILAKHNPNVAAKSAPESM